MKKVVHFLGSSSYGGGSKVSIDIARITKTMGYETYFFTNNKKTQKKLRENDINIISSKYGLSIIKNIYSLYVFLKKNNVDVIHTHTTVWGYVGRFTAKLAGTKIIIHHVHNLYYYMPNNVLIKIFSYLVEAVFSKYFSDILIFIEKEKFQNFKIKTKAKKIYIPNGVDNNKKNIKSRAEANTRINIGFLGRLEKAKGLDKLLSLFLEEEISKKYNLIIAGSGKLESLVEIIENDNLNIKYLGFLDNVGEFFNIIDIMILPTKYEGLSMAILESLAYGKPVITTNIAGNRYLIYNDINGFLYKMDDYAHLKIILEGLTVEKCCNMKDASKDIALKYDMNIFNNNIENLYRKIYV